MYLKYTKCATSPIKMSRVILIWSDINSFKTRSLCVLFTAISSETKVCLAHNRCSKSLNEWMGEWMYTKVISECVHAQLHAVLTDREIFCGLVINSINSSPKTVSSHIHLLTVNLGAIIYFCMPQFSHLYNGKIIVPTSLVYYEY